MSLDTATKATPAKPTPVTRPAPSVDLANESASVEGFGAAELYSGAPVAGSRRDGDHLQRTVGNQAMVRAVTPGAPASPLVQRAPDGSHQSGCGCGSCSSLESIVARTNPLPAVASSAPAPAAGTIQRHHDEDEVQRKPAAPDSAPASAHAAGPECGCPSCSSMSAIVQRTTDVALTPASGVIQRQSGGHGPGCGCP
ncbi:MAG: hypothetical protein ACRC1H_04270, partial [Caldilineaceae bacterium]